MKYRIIDLSCYTDEEIQNLEGGWYEDYDSGDVCYDFKDVHEFTSSLMYNLEVQTVDDDWVDVESAYKTAIANLLERGYCEVNGFGFEVYE